MIKKSLLVLLTSLTISHNNHGMHEHTKTIDCFGEIITPELNALSIDEYIQKIIADLDQNKQNQSLTVEDFLSITQPAKQELTEEKKERTKNLRPSTTHYTYNHVPRLVKKTKKFDPSYKPQRRNLSKTTIVLNDLNSYICACGIRIGNHNKKRHDIIHTQTEEKKKRFICDQCLIPSYFAHRGALNQHKRFHQ